MLKSTSCSELLKNPKGGWILLIDPDKASPESVARRIELAHTYGASCLFVGGSQLNEGSVEDCLSLCASLTELPKILFPGPDMPLSNLANGILFLSLISGRNPDLLIGQQVKAAPTVRRLKLEALPTAYILVAGEQLTTAHKVSDTDSLAPNDIENAGALALAAKYMGMQFVYLDAGSGASHPVPSALIRAIRDAVDLPIIVGGGITKPEQLKEVKNAGANWVVIGTLAELNPNALQDLL
jgi:phosphoglycerol geranylgeranyltransferase